MRTQIFKAITTRMTTPISTGTINLNLVLLSVLFSGVLTGCQNLYTDKAIASPIDQEVYVSLGTLQCQAATASQKQLRTDALKSQLQQAGIVVKAVSLGSDGRMRIQQCGTPDGQVVIFRVAANDVGKAQRLGYVLVDAAVRKVPEQKHVQ